MFVMYYQFSESLLNTMEDIRAELSAWYAVGWMPIIDEEKSLRPGRGYDSDAARSLRVFHECWIQTTSFIDYSTEAGILPGSAGDMFFARLFNPRMLVLFRTETVR